MPGSAQRARCAVHDGPSGSGVRRHGGAAPVQVFALRAAAPARGRRYVGRGGILRTGAPAAAAAARGQAKSGRRGPQPAAGTGAVLC